MPAPTARGPSASGTRWMRTLLSAPGPTPMSSGTAVLGTQRSTESFEPGARQRCATKAKTMSATETS